MPVGIASSSHFPKAWLRRAARLDPEQFRHLVLAETSPSRHLEVQSAPLPTSAQRRGRAPRYRIEDARLLAGMEVVGDDRRLAHFIVALQRSEVQHGCE